MGSHGSPTGRTAATAGPVIPIAPVFLHYGVDLSDVYNQLVLCPAHGESRPSCSVNTEKGVFFCFACEAKGTALNLIMLVEGVDRAAALDKAGGILKSSGHEMPSKLSGRYRRPGEELGSKSRAGRYVPPGRRSTVAGH